MTQVNVININSPFLDQKPGTSGLRKSTLKFQEKHYLEVFIEAILQSLEDLKGSTLVVGGDGRYGNIEAIEKIVQICIAHKVQKVIVPKYGLLSTPATSHLIRKENAIGGIILSASHNPGGIDGDFGVKLNISNPVVSEQNSMHERLYQAATNIPLRRKVGSEEFMENVNSTNLNDNLTDSGAGKWSSGLNDSGSGIVKNRSFWLVADAELIVYGATEPSAKLTIGGEDVPLAADGTFRIQVPFRDGTQKYDIKAVDVSGEQEKSISMKFDRTTPLDDTNEKDNAETEWF